MKGGIFSKRFLALSAFFMVGAMAYGQVFEQAEDVVLSAPTSSFELQLELMKVSPSKFAAVPATNGYFQQTLDAELADLRLAFGFRNMGPENEAVVNQYEAARRQLDRYVEHKNRNHGEENVEQEEQKAGDTLPGTVPGLPEEFALYWSGLLALKSGNVEGAQREWKELLDLPAEKRKFRTVWATYMLGRAANTNWAEAIPYYHRTRKEAQSGFKDSVGLAEASLGWEAQAEYKSGRFVPALRLYAEQWASGDPTAQSSLELVTRCLINSETDLGEVAADGLAQRVVTAFLLSKTPRGETDTARVRLWIAAVENAGPADAAMGERLALAAYQAGDFELAGSWIKRAPKSSLVTQWIQAKLFLREGKLDRSAALMAKIATAFPPGDSTNGVSKFEETLRGKQHYSADGQARGELATLQLARREFAQSLNTLMETGTAYWRDAAYIAERVLTMEELKNYVDSHPVARAKDEEANEHEKNLEQAGDQLRYLLARRLTRENRMEEARSYFPEERLGSLDNLVGALKNSRDRNLDRQARAEAFWTAAVIVRTNGMELMGTELEPDFFVNGGGEQREIVVERKSSITNVAHASEAELERALKPMTNPNKRFHYRYLAAGLGWQAAKMMSDNEENTALVLCRAGGWVKDNDPELADLFYKALVRRCRKLPIGQEADKRRWFPDLDDTGNYVPRGSKPKVTEIPQERADSVETEETPIIQ